MEVTRYKAGDGQGSTLAWLNLKVIGWGVTFNDCRLMRARNGVEFLAVQTRSYEKDGETKYIPAIWFNDKEVSERFQKAAKSAIDVYVKEHSEIAHDGNGSRDEPPF